MKAYVQRSRAASVKLEKAFKKIETDDPYYWRDGSAPSERDRRPAGWWGYPSDWQPDDGHEKRNRKKITLGDRGLSSL
eukprot:12648209-Alexandrium_andersonii.AAC.1